MKLYEIYEDRDDGTEFEWRDTANISQAAYPRLVKHFESINKKATKLGVPAITLTIVREFDKPVIDPDTGKPDLWGRTEKMYEVRVDGETPKLDGWDFLATVEHTDGGNIIRAVPGADEADLKQFYEAKPHYCDWCKKARNRIDTFIVRSHKTGELKQVGRNCLKDFLGGADPKAILQWFVWRSDIGKMVEDAEDEERERGGRPKREAPVDLVLALGAAAVREYGYIKSSGEHGSFGSTPDMVKTVLFSRPPMNPNSVQAEWFKRIRPTDEDTAKAKEVVDWFNSLPDEEKQSPFMHNVNVILNSQRISERSVGYAVALFPMYERFKRMDHEKKSTDRSNQHIGAVGDKIGPIKVKVIRTRVISGGYGQTQICSMEDQAGNTLVWFNNSAHDLDEGAELTIMGTVKKHDDFNGRKQTHLTRVKVVPDGYVVPQKGAKKAAKTAEIPATSTERPVVSQQNTPQPADPQASGSKSAMAIAWFKNEMATNGVPPSRAVFIQTMTQPPYGMTPAGASTYYQKIKKALVEGMSFAQYLLLVG